MVTQAIENLAPTGGDGVKEEEMGYTAEEEAKWKQKEKAMYQESPRGGLGRKVVRAATAPGLLIAGWVPPHPTCSGILLPQEEWAADGHVGTSVWDRQEAVFSAVGHICAIRGGGCPRPLECASGS